MQSKTLSFFRKTLLFSGISFILFFFINAEKSSKAIDSGNQPTPVISPVIPADVVIPGGFSGNPIAFFDDYSWRAFIALVWPAKANQRGVADTSQALGANAPLVFETYKADWEIFHPDGSSPAAGWNSFNDPVPCKIPGSFGFNDLALVNASKFGNIGQAGFGNLVGPIVAQNGTYVRYLTAFNQIEFDKIMADSLYLQAKLKNVTFPNGAIDVKSSWIEMSGVSHPERYYTRNAWVFDLVSNTCKNVLVGLVGLHIVQKTPSRPQWIWSTFEQVDNIPQHGAAAPYAFNDGKGTPMPASNPIAFPPPVTPPAPFNIDRKMPINPSTVTTNQLYQQAIQNQGNSVWQFYQLTMTQWPTTPNNPALPGTPANTFPGLNPTSAFSNVTLETFDQTNIRTGCMNCHNLTKSNTDFLWALKVNAFPSVALQSQTVKVLEANVRLQSGVPNAKLPATVQDKSIEQLRKLLSN